MYVNSGNFKSSNFHHIKLQHFQGIQHRMSTVCLCTDLPVCVSLFVCLLVSYVRIRCNFPKVLQALPAMLGHGHILRPDYKIPLLKCVFVNAVDGHCRSEVLMNQPMRTHTSSSNLRRLDF